MSLRIFQRGRVAFLVGGEVGMDQLDQSIQVFCCNLHNSQSVYELPAIALTSTYRLILLVEIVDVAVQYFHKQLHRHRCVHASICNSKRSLQALKDTLAIAVELRKLISTSQWDLNNQLTFFASSSPLAGISIPHHRWLAR